MLALAAYLANSVPGWLHEPGWWRPLTHALRHFVLQHQTGGLFFVIFFEELGVPLPGPGDVAIAYGGYLTTTGTIPYPMAYAAVVGGAVLGSACNLTLSRRYGRPFIQRFGGFIGITEEKLPRRTDIQAVGSLGDHRRPPYPWHADRPVRPVWNTRGPLQGIHTVRPYICLDLGSDLPRARKATGAPGAGAFRAVPGTPDSLVGRGFDTPGDRVSGI